MTDDVVHVDLTGRAPDALVDVPAVTGLDEIADRLRNVDAGSITLLVDARPGFSVVYSLKIDGPQLAAWRRAAKDDNTGFVDDYQWERTILAAQCREIRVDGKTMVEKATGKPVTFRSAELWAFLNVPAGAPAGAGMAVRAFYAGNDFAIDAAADKVITEAGYGKAAQVDPTSGPSST
jgi:hypothetical protein